MQSFTHVIKISKEPTKFVKDVFPVCVFLLPKYKDQMANERPETHCFGYFPDTQISGYKFGCLDHRIWDGYGKFRTFWPSNKHQASPNFFWNLASNSMVKFGPKPAWRPIFGKFRSCLTTPPRLRMSPGRSELALPGDLRSLGGVVKRLWNWLKIGLQAGFGLNFTVEFEA